MRIVFAGTPEFAARSLDAVLAAGHDVVLVLAQPDRPSGRGMKRQAGPVKSLATERGIPVLQPLGLRVGGRHDGDARAARDRLAATPHDVMVVAAYGLILPATVLAVPRHGCINVHASLLPRWRGAAPIQRAIEAGDAETGITIMQMDEGLDTGAMLSMRRIAIDAADTAGTLTDRLADLGGRALVEALAALDAGTLAPTPQPADGATYAAKLSKAESPLDLSRPSRAIVDRIRAFDPWPGCTADLVDGAATRVASFKVWGAKAAPTIVRADPGQVLGASDDGVVVATGDGAIVVTALQKPGGRRLPAAAFSADFARAPGLRFVAAG